MMISMLRCLCIIILMICAGCFSKESQKLVKLSQVRVGAPVGQMIDYPVDRELFKQALGRIASIERLRMVPILRSGSGIDEFAIPEYRLFNIDPGSPYQLLGLKEKDVLIAANDYVIYEADRFKAYVQAIAAEEQAFVEIRRHGEPMIFHYRWE